MRRLMFVLLLVPGSAFAQVPPVINPTGLTFTASPDQGKALPDGTKAVTSYAVRIEVVNAPGITVASADVGLPTPDASNTIQVTVPAFATLGFGQYLVHVAAIGPGGEGVSAPSDPFDVVTKPAAAGKPTVKR